MPKQAQFPKSISTLATENRVMRAVFAIVVVVFIAISIFFSLVLLQDHNEQKCWEMATAKIQDNPDQLVEIPELEKEALGMGRGFIPTKRYYEKQKCLYGVDSPTLGASFRFYKSEECIASNGKCPQLGGAHAQPYRESFEGAFSSLNLEVKTADENAKPVVFADWDCTEASHHYFDKDLLSVREYQSVPQNNDVYFCWPLEPLEENSTVEYVTKKQ